MAGWLRQFFESFNQPFQMQMMNPIIQLDVEMLSLSGHLYTTKHWDCK
jgi:hypothetical protein